MAINKEKNVTIQVTFPKEDAEQLEALKNAFNKNNIKVTKSDILVHALREYIKILVMCGQSKKQKVEEPQGDKENA